MMRFMRVAMAWLLLSSQAFAVPSAVAPPSSANSINAADYGLVCNGVADNANAFAAIKAKLQATTGSNTSVFFPPSTLPCMTSSALSAVSGITYYAQPGTVTIKAISNSVANPLLVSASSVSSVVFYGIVFDGNLPSVPSSANLMTVYQSSGVVFDHVTVQHTRGIGLLFSTSVSNSGVRDSSFNDLGNYWIVSGANSDQQQGIAFCCGTGNNSNFVNDSYFSSIGLDAISVALQTDFQSNGNRFRSVGGRAINGGAAIYVSNTDGIQIVGNDVNVAFGNGLDLHITSRALVTGNKVRSSSGGGMTFAQITTAIIAGNLVFNSNQGNASSFTGGIAIQGANSNLTVSANTSTDDQTTKTQVYGFQSLTGSTCLLCTVDGSNNLDGNATAAFGGPITAYTSKVSATVAWGAQFGTGSTAGVQLLPGTSGALMVGPHDSSNAGGVAPGTYAVDLGMSRLSSGQVATGDHSAILGGSNNNAGGQFSTVLGGTWNTTNGPGSAAMGEFAQDRYRPGILAMASGQNGTNGDSQSTISTYHLSTTSVTPTRINGNLNSGGGGTPNNATCYNLPNINFPTNQEALYGFSIRIVATDVTNPGSFLHYWEPLATLYKTTTLSTTAYIASGQAVTKTVGTTGTISISADVTNGCPAVTWTAPNTDTWHVVMRIDGAEGF